MNFNLPRLALSASIAGNGIQEGLMKALIPLMLCMLTVGAGFADTTVDASNPYAYGANIGWINARGDIASGAVFGQSYCTGYLYSANCGWISLGNGPTNGWRYSNTAADDWGVNHDGTGSLTGFAYGANIGWIAFEQTYGQPRVDLLTGNLSGYVWGANVGWISLSNAQAYVQTPRLDSGPDSDADGIPDFWEMKQVGDLATLSGAGHDEDDDGASDTDEYSSDTDPTDINSSLEITALERLDGTNLVTWSIEPTRFYKLEHASSASNNADWGDSGHGIMSPELADEMTRELADSAQTSQFFRARAIVPLSP